MPYTLETRDGAVEFRTAQFSAEGGSMLHAGIFNRELTASFAGGAVTIVTFLAMALTGRTLGMADAAAAALVFAVSVVFFRVAVFREEYLRAVFDPGRKEVRLRVKRFIARSRTIPFADIRGVVRGLTVITPVNRDGIEIVEKIALQHHTVLPGFGEEKEYHTVSLDLAGGDAVLLLGAREAGAADELAATLRTILESGNA
jgi:hypothetical protein